MGSGDDFATIGVGIGIHSVFGGGDSLPQVSGDKEDCWTECDNNSELTIEKYRKGQ